jgi:hypothetical protein
MPGEWLEREGSVASVVDVPVPSGVQRGRVPVTTMSASRL